MKTVYIVARHFAHNSGSYEGMIQEFSKYASKKGYRVKILCARVDKKEELHEKRDYAEVIRFKIPLGGILDSYGVMVFYRQYGALGSLVEKYFNENPPFDGDLFLANGRAALGVKNQKFVMRMVQPALTFLKNMEIAKDEVSVKTRIARYFHFKLLHGLEKKCAKNAAGFIFSSIASKDIAYKTFNVKNKPYFIPHSGVNISEFQHGKRSEKFKGRNILFVGSGREKERKGIIYLEKVLPKMFKEYPDVKLLHVGEKVDWNISEIYKNRIISNGERVPWDQMKDYYASADFIVSPALNEAIPNVVFEAMAAGLPVLASDTEGIEEVISHKKDGYIFKRGDVNGMLEGMRFMLGKKINRENASVSLKKKISKIDYEDYSKKLLEYLISLQNDKRTESVNLLK